MYYINHRMKFYINETNFQKALVAYITLKNRSEYRKGKYNIDTT